MKEKEENNYESCYLNLTAESSSPLDTQNSSSIKLEPMQNQIYNFMLTAVAGISDVVKVLKVAYYHWAFLEVFNKLCFRKYRLQILYFKPFKVFNLYELHLIFTIHKKFMRNFANQSVIFNFWKYLFQKNSLSMVVVILLSVLFPLFCFLTFFSIRAYSLCRDGTDSDTESVS